MELQALLVLCGLGVAGVAVVLLMGLFSASGTSYEEAIAQQRRATTELLALAEGKNKPKKKEKKANKKLAKKEKKEATAATGSEPESEAPGESGADEDPVAKPHVEFCPPVVVDVPRDTPPNVKIRKRGKDHKVKPILLNKEDPSCVSDPSTPSPPPLNHFEELHPKDEFELLHSSLAADKVVEKKEDVEKPAKESHKAGKPAKAKGAKSAPAVVTPEPVKEEPKEEPQEKTEKEKSKEQRGKGAKKPEKKSISEDSVDAPREEVVPPLNVPQPAELTTDKLLKQVATATAASASPPGGKGKKKKSEPNVLSLMAAGDGGGVNVGELVRVVREAALSRTEIQILTDALLNKHHDPLPQHSEWTEGPNDPMQKLKKQLADKEKALADEIEASQALHAKLKELRATLNAERTRAASSARAAEQNAAAARAESHTLQTRLQRLLEENQHLAQEKMMLQSKLGQEGEAQAQRVQMEMHIQRLSEAEGALMAQLSALQAEAGARAVDAQAARCEASAARDAAILAQQHANELATQLQEANRAYSELEHRMQQVSAAERSAQAELRQAQDKLAATADLQPEVQRANARATTAEATAEKLKEETEKQKQEIEKLKQEIEKQKQEVEKQKQEVEMQKQEVEKQKQEVQRANARATTAEATAEKLKEETEKQKQEIEKLKQEIEKQKQEVEKQKQEVEMQKQEVEKQKQEVEKYKQEVEKQKQEVEKYKQEVERQKQQLSAEVSSLRELLSAREAELAELKAMKAAPAHNGLPPTDQHKAAELAKVESMVETLRAELAAASRASSEQREQLATMQAQLAAYQTKNNELRTKNWKVMEALQSAEKALQGRSKAAPAQDTLTEASVKVVEAQYNEVASVLRAVFPTASPTSSIGKEWLQAFADNLKKELEKREAEKKLLEKKLENAVKAEKVEKPSDSRVSELTAQNEHLQGLVDKYKRIIDDTEGVLSRLQANVTTEEQRWARQLADKQRELDQLRATTLQQMQSKIEGLQAELLQAKAGNHNHSFADAERHTEERLMMAGLSNKPSADFSNGPLQVELEEK